MAGATVTLQFESSDDEARFCREFLPDAWDRFLTSAYWEAGWFWAYRQYEPYDWGPAGGLVRLVFEGDPDALVASERDRWRAFEGLDEWELARYEEMGYDSLLEQQRDAKGEREGEWEYRLKPLVSAFTLAYYREFENALPVVAEGNEDEANETPFGFWTVIHNAMAQSGYDWYEETRACQQALQNRLKSLAAYRGADAAREEYERIREAWTAFDEELNYWLDEHETGQASLP